jgi:hypothetical protein
MAPFAAAFAQLRFVISYRYRKTPQCVGTFSPTLDPLRLDAWESSAGPVLPIA